MKEKLKKLKVIMEILLVVLSVASCFRSGATFELIGLGTSVICTALALIIVSLLGKLNLRV